LFSTTIAFGRFFGKILPKLTPKTPPEMNHVCLIFLAMFTAGRACENRGGRGEKAEEMLFFSFIGEALFAVF
jgi:hypothetical protein